MSELTNNIINQMGGLGKLVAMTGANNFVDHGDALVFKFKLCKKSNMVKITHTDMDLYTVEFLKLNMRKVTCDVTKSYEGLYAEDLKTTFESETGLSLSFT